MKKTKKVPQPTAKAKPKVKDPSTSELPEDQLEKVAGGAGTVAPMTSTAAPGTASTAAAGNLTADQITVKQTFQKIDVTLSTGGKGFTDDWEK